MPRLETDRLSIIPLSAPLLRAALADPSELGRLLGVRVASDWPNADLAELLPAVLADLERDATRVDWGPHVILQRGDGVLIGSAGFLGPPDAQCRVEIGYDIALEHRRRGYATEGVRALLDWALRHSGLQRVVAECAEDNVASVRVLEKVGMHRRSAEGTTLHWELRTDQNHQARPEVTVWQLK